MVNRAIATSQSVNIPEEEIKTILWYLQSKGDDNTVDVTYVTYCLFHSRTYNSL